MVHALRRRGRGVVASVSDKLPYRIGLRSADALPLPDFLGIGAQKSGTTWLHENLSRHPDLYLPRERKELHYFDNAWERPLAEYASHFAAAGDRTKGEITPAYGVLPPDRIRFIHRVMPDLRLLLLLRNPVDRAWSAAYMNLVQSTGRQLDDVGDDEFVAHFRSPDSRARGDYLGVIERWTAVFPPERLFVGFYDELESDPHGLLRRVFVHLGVRTDVDADLFPAGERILPWQAPAGAPPVRPALAGFLRDLYAADTARLADRLGGPASAWAV